MITREQFLEFNKYVSERIETQEKFILDEIFLNQRFGITQPFWEDMCKFAEECSERFYLATPITFTVKFTDEPEDPVEVEFTRKT